MPESREPTRNEAAKCGLLAAFARYLRARGGNVAAITALMIVPLVGLFGLAGEGSYWGLVHRAEQNAADSAAIAAGNTYQSCLDNGASNGNAPSCTSTSYQPAGWAVTAKNGFTNGASDSSGNTAVTITGGVTCPSNVTVSNPHCIQVTVTKKVPMYLVKVVGYNGNTVFNSGPYNGGRGQLISATAIAGTIQTPTPACVLALQNSQTAQGITLHGNPNADLGSCTIYSDSNATCTGHNSGAYIGGAQYTDSNCGILPVNNAGYVADPYSGLASNIPSYTCSSNPGATLPPGNYSPATLAAALGGVTTTDSSGNTYIEVCGNLNIADGTIATLTSGNALVVINNGQLAYAAKPTTTSKLATSGTAGMTLIFQGNSSTAFSGVNNGGSGTYEYLDLAAPTTGTWAGVTIYDPVATSQSYAGNAPAWDLTGLIYFPNATVDWSGIIGKATSGYECFDLVVYNLTIDGTANLFQPSGGNAITNPNLQCHEAGLTQPQANVGTRYVLVS